MLEEHLKTNIIREYYIRYGCQFIDVVVCRWWVQLCQQKSSLFIIDKKKKGEAVELNDLSPLDE